MEWGIILRRFRQCFDQIPDYDTRAKISPRQFVISLIFGFVNDRGRRSLDSIRRNIMTMTGEELARSSFWERLATQRLFGFVLTVAEEAIMQMTQIAIESAKLQALLKVLKVNGILIVDSSSISLPAMAGAVFPGPRTNVAPSVIKWHSCFDLAKGLIKWFDLGAGTSHDQNHFPDLPSLAGHLVIFDLGYFDYCLLQAIANVGGFFLCRIKTNAVVQVSKVVQGLPKKWQGKMLFGGRLPKGKNVIELMGLFKDGCFEFRVIGFWNPVDGVYHWYVTNLLVPAKLIYPLYRLRWQTELLFKMAKSGLRSADIASADTNIVQTLVLASIVATTLTQPIAFIMARLHHEENPDQIPSLQRAGCVLVQIRTELAAFLLDGRGKSKINLIEKLKLFKKEIFDPNRNRETSIQRVLRTAGLLA